MLSMDSTCEWNEHISSKLIYQSFEFSICIIFISIPMKNYANASHLHMELNIFYIKYIILIFFCNQNRRKKRKHVDIVKDITTNASFFQFIIQTCMEIAGTIQHIYFNTWETIRRGKLVFSECLHMNVFVNFAFCDQSAR